MKAALQAVRSRTAPTPEGHAEAIPPGAHAADRWI